MGRHIHKINEARAPEVGIFFVINGRVLGWGDPVRELHSYNGFYDSPLTHMEYFDELVDVFPELKLSHLDDYALFPRGRVIYNENTGRFKVFADRCILKDEHLKALVLEEFSLPKDKTDWEWDEHYTCKDCDKDLIETDKLNKLAAISNK